MADKKNAVAELFEQGKTSGKLTTQEINDAIEDLDYDKKGEKKEILINCYSRYLNKIFSNMLFLTFTFQ